LHAHDGSPNAKLTDDEERAKEDRTGTLGWQRSSSFGAASSFGNPRSISQNVT